MNAGDPQAAIESSERDRLQSLAARDPAAAIIAARTVLASQDDLRVAGLLVDLGARIAGPAAAEEGLAVIARVSESCDAETEFGRGVRYMLGTAQGTVAKLKWPSSGGPMSVESGKSMRHDARSNLFRATTSSSSEQATMAWTNLGHELCRSARRVEAYDCYSNAYKLERHPVAAGWMAQVLHDFIAVNPATPDEVVTLSHRLASVAQGGPEEVDHIALDGTSRKFSGIPSDRADEWRPVPVPSPDSYEAFIRDKRLYLSVAADGLPLNKWDNGGLTPFPDVAATLGGGPSPIIGMANVLKADYCAARRIVYQALTGEFDDAKLFVDSGDGARYGMEPALFRLGLRSALDCLDRVAAAANQFWCLDVAPRYTHFRTIFRQGEDLHPRIVTEYESHNWAMAGLVELADDLRDKESWLGDFHDLRNTATHRFLRVVPTNPMGENGVIYDVSFEEISLACLRALSMVRSAILAFYSAVRFSAERTALTSSGGGVIWGDQD